MNLKEFTEKYGNKEVDEMELKELLGMKVSKAWKPKYGESYWFIDNFGGVSISTWDDMTADTNRYNLGNCYKTREETFFARDKQIFMTKLERDFAENSDEIDLKSGQLKHSIYINGEGYIKTEFYRNIRLGVPVTTNREWLENYIEENEADIKKYYFGKGE